MKTLCPLCKSLLTEETYLKVKESWDKNKVNQKKLKDEIAQLKKNKSLLLKEKREAIKLAFDEGKKKEKSRADRLSVLVQTKTKELNGVTKKLLELENHLKKGTTPQTDGFEFESEIVSQLQSAFPDDIIEHYGKTGDILQRIFWNEVEIGSIVFECKKTSTFTTDYIHQTKKAAHDRKANFGVLISFSTKKEDKGFFIDNEIIVIHPYSTVYLVQILRNFIIENHSLKVKNTDISLKNQTILNFLESPEFTSTITNIIYRISELVLLLERERKEHERIWKKRKEHYLSINTSTETISTNLIL